MEEGTNSAQTTAGMISKPELAFPGRPRALYAHDRAGCRRTRNGLSAGHGSDLRRRCRGRWSRGPSAAVYAASEGLSTLVLEAIASGGQAGASSRIENYLGFPTGISGYELAGRAEIQAQKFGAQLAVPHEVVGIDQEAGLHCLKLSDGKKIRSRSVVIATGASYRKLNIFNYEQFENKGIYYAATGLEADLCRERDVVVVEGGNSAGQVAVFLSAIASHVHLIVRKESLASTISTYLISRIEHSPLISLHSSTEIERVNGNRMLEQLT